MSVRINSNDIPLVTIDVPATGIDTDPDYIGNLEDLIFQIFKSNDWDGSFDIEVAPFNDSSLYRAIQQIDDQPFRVLSASSSNIQIAMPRMAYVKIVNVIKNTGSASVWIMGKKRG